MSTLAPESNRQTLRIISDSEALPGQYPDPSEPLTPNTSTQLSLAQAVHDRRAEYTRPRSSRIKIGTWNVAAHKSTDQDIGAWFVEGKGISEHLRKGPLGHDGAPTRSQEEELESVGEQEARHKKKQPTVPKDDPGLLPGGEDVGLYVLGLQEIVDINSAVEALRPFSDVATPGRFKKAMEKALPKGYELVADQQLIGLLLLVWASPEVKPHVHSVSTTSVGTGLMGYMGNKGAVTARIVLGESTRLVFINSHLGAGTGKTELERRHWDTTQIASRTRFDPITDGLGIVQEQGERIGDEDHAFWFGDLNYRLEGVPPDGVRKILMLHTRNEYDIGQRSQKKISKELFSSGSSISHDTSRSSKDGAKDHASSLSGASTKVESNAEDPASLQATINSLLPHDELLQSQKAGKAFADWKEGRITFLPTYKYDVGSVGVFDSGEKKRGPSWCDRILYRSRKDRLNYEEKLRAEKEARRRDDEMKKQGLDQAAEDESTMFEYDPEQDADENYDDPGSGPAPTSVDEAAAMPEDLVLEYYTSHQRVLSADHKPLAAVFKLKYDAAVPELKTKVQQEVAKEFDRLENEGRPVLTVVVDGSLHGDDPNFSGINFGHVRYDDPKMKSVTLANTGRVPAHFGFVNSPQHTERETTAAKWLSVNLDIPSEKTNGTSKSGDDVWDHDVDSVFKLEPGGTANVDVLSHVKDKEVVRRFNDGETMEDILILRVKDGRDHFLPVRGHWQQSVHGRTLDRLIRLPEGGVRALQNQRPEGSRERSTSGEVRWSAPKEIFRLTKGIENLTERVVAEWTMVGLDGQPPWMQHAGWPFVEEGWMLDEETRRGLRVEANEALDNDQQLKGVLASLPALHKLEVLVDVLLDLLRHLEDGVVTADLWSEIEGKLGQRIAPSEKRASVMEFLSTARSHSVSFILITSMLGRVVQEVTAGYQATPPQSRANSELPNSPRVKVRRKTLDKDAMVASKQLVVKNMAAVFADVLVRVPEGENMEGTEGQRRELVEMFLEGEPA